MTQHEILKKFVLGIKKDLANSLLVVGSAGTGKTETVLSGLKELKLTEGEHFKYLNNYSSPLEFYHTLGEMNELKEPRILILDDAEEFINDKRILGILRASLWAGTDNKRIIHWNSPRAKETSFEFAGKIIFLLNELNLKNSLVCALISRGFYFHFSLTNQEKLELMRKRAEKPYRDLSKKERQRIMNYIEKVGEFSGKLTLRTLPQAFSLYILSPNHYQTLVAEMLK